ncbi:MAG: hypothetical protein QGH60_05135 [Phycisphaerae bacterium]|nr:hypothetical protein [Phycisphaerae bacterium]
MSLPLLAIYSIACLSLGARVLRLILRTDSLEERCGVVVGASSAMLLGQGVLANVWLLIGLTGWFKTWVVAVVLMVCVRVGWRSARSLLTASGRTSRLQWDAIRSEGRPWRLLGYLLIAQIIVMGIGALFMPARGDAVAFYMTVAKYMAHYERLTPLPGTYHDFTQVGLQGEMHYAALMSLCSESAAKGFVWPTSLAGMGMLLGIGGMAGLRRRGKWIAVAMYFTSTAVTLISVDAKVDLFAAAMGVAAIYWALQTSDNPWRAACLCGLFTSLAAVAKFSYIGALVPCVFALLVWRRFSAAWLCGLLTSLAAVAKFGYIGVLVPGVFALLVWRRLTSRPDGGRLKSMMLTGLGVLAVWGVCALLAGVPHLIKNGVLFGHPLAPFVGGSNAWHVQNWYADYDDGAAIVRRIHRTYPLALVFGDYPMQYGTLSPLILAFFPLVVLSWRRAKPLGSPLFQVTAAAIFGLVVFTCLSPSVFAPRYTLAPLLILILPAALGAQLALESGRRGRVLATVIIAASIVVVLGRLGRDVSRCGGDSVKYVVGRLIDPERLRPDAGSAGVLNAHAGLDEPIILASYNCYWVRPDLLGSSLTAGQLSSMRKDATPEQRWWWLYQRGVRLILLDARSFGTETPESIIVYPDSKSISPGSGATGLLSTAETPDGLAVKVLYRKKGRIVLQLGRTDQHPTTNKKRPITK